MSKFTSTLLILGICSSSLSVFAQTYAVGHTSITFKDPNRSNRSIPCEIYYPATSAGDNSPISSDRKFPCIAFGHGFVMTWDAYKNVWNTLVPQGFVVAFPKTEGTASPSHSQFGSDLAFVLSAMKSEGSNSSSLFYNQVDSMNCVMGHSMGGGAAFLAASKSNQVKFIATLAAAETNPSAIKAAASLTIPSLVLAAGNDCVTPPKDHQIPLYDSLKSNCKTFVSITGGSHCQMAEDNFLCNFGEATCSPKPSITRGEQHQIQFQFLIPWLRYHLLQDAAAANIFDSLVGKSKAVETRKNCQLQPMNNSNERILIQYKGISIYPNPASNKIHITFKNIEQSAEIQLLSFNGKLLYDWKVDNNSNADITLNIPSEIARGIYLFRVKINNETTNHRILIDPAGK